MINSTRQNWSSSSAPLALLPIECPENIGRKVEGNQNGCNRGTEGAVVLRHWKLMIINFVIISEFLNSFLIVI
jgi:hypothetical protein